MMSDPKIDVLMATHNGGRFLSEQVESVLGQSYSNIRLLISDDGSTDNTKDLLNDICAKDARICFIDHSKVFGSASLHFMSLLQRSSDNYFAFCDQDDIWMPNKLEASMRLLQKLEKEEGPDKPAMVFSDMVVVDKCLNVIANSYLDSSGKDKNSYSLSRLLTTNIVAGCTILGNAKLGELARRSCNDACLMHDWWVALVAASCGRIAMLGHPTVLYRQHSANVIGAESYSFGKKLLGYPKSISKYWASCDQAKALFYEYGSEMKTNEFETVQAFAFSSEGKRVKALDDLRKYDLYKQNVAARMGQILTTLFFAPRNVK